MAVFTTLSLLTRSEEAELARRVHGPDAADSLAARNEMVLSNLGLVGKAACYCARRYTSDYDDLFSEGMLALISAAEGYDPALHHTRFSTYAIPAIRFRMRDWVQDDHRIAVPHYLQEPRQLAKKLNPLRTERSRRLLTERLNEARQALASSDSDAVPLDRGLPALDDLIQHETVERVVTALGELAPLHVYILAHRHGLCGLAVKTLRELGDEFGLPRQRISQIEVRAMTDLGRALRIPGRRSCA